MQVHAPIILNQCWLRQSSVYLWSPLLWHVLPLSNEVGTFWNHCYRRLYWLAWYSACLRVAQAHAFTSTSLMLLALRLVRCLLAGVTWFLLFFFSIGHVFALHAWSFTAATYQSRLFIDSTTYLHSVSSPGCPCQASVLLEKNQPDRKKYMYRQTKQLQECAVQNFLLLGP